MNLQSPYTIANRVRMSRNNKQYRTFIFVEGPSDEKLWSKFIPDSICKLQGVCGKTNVIKLLDSDTLHSIEGVAGIVDADYWLIADSPELNSENLIFDKCFPDAEIILLRSSALTDVIADKLDTNDYQLVERFTDELRSAGEKLAMQFGYFRLLNELRDYGIDFKGFWENHRYDEFIDSDLRTIHLQHFAQSLTDDHDLRAKWGQVNQIACDDLLGGVKELKKYYPMPNIKLCRGHDVVAIMSSILPHMFQSYFRHRLPSSMKSLCRHKVLECNLREKYKEAYFKQTSLFNRICHWQEENHPYRILRHPCP